MELAALLLMIGGGLALYFSRRTTTPSSRTGIVLRTPSYPNPTLTTPIYRPPMAAPGPSALPPRSPTPSTGDPIGSFRLPDNPLITFVSDPGGSYKRPEYAEIDRIITSTSSRFGLEASVMRALAWIESTWRPNPGGISLGLMQIYWPTSGRDFSGYGWTRNVTRDQVANDPEISMELGATIFRWNVRRFNGDYDRAIVAYNNWSAALAGAPYPTIWTDGKVHLDPAPGVYLQRVRDAERSKPWAR